ncbi:NAD(P)/FAD-dependent oxidoreductase [Actinoplanes sp. NPDC089786]|uniref:FAD-dependent oxidoreductase n=1 Tax=Actinoplanes sp. NPDC089786 TaxID=3155185 RepID=UPI0034286B8B
MTITVVGAGLSGLICARILQQHGIDVVVYEMDPSDTARQQGGSLDIHDNSGQIALREAGLYDEFRKRTHPGGEAIRMLDKTARVYLNHGEPEGGNGRPEIDRKILRKMLVDSLTPGTIRWGRKVAAVRSAGDGYEVEFADRRTAHADVLIGADGAWSKVRELLTSVKPEYTGITVVEMRLSDAATRHPEALATTGTGNLFALSDNKYIGGHGGNQIAFACGLRVPENWVTASGIDWDNPPAAREALLREFSDWAPALTDLIRDCDDTIWPRPIYALPTGHTWDRVPGVTLLGDAAHLMSPFAGEGANMAMIDGADLAREILGRTDVDEAIAAYELKMFRRGAKAAGSSARSLDLMFADGPPRKLVALFRGMFLLQKVTRPFERVFAKKAPGPRGGQLLPQEQPAGEDETRKRR